MSSNACLAIRKTFNTVTQQRRAIHHYMLLHFCLHIKRTPCCLGGGLLGPIHCMQAAIPRLVERQRRRRLALQRSNSTRSSTVSHWCVGCLDSHCQSRQPRKALVVAVPAGRLRASLPDAVAAAAVSSWQYVADLKHRCLVPRVAPSSAQRTSTSHSASSSCSMVQPSSTCTLLQQLPSCRFTTTLLLPGVTSACCAELLAPA